LLGVVVVEVEEEEEEEAEEAVVQRCFLGAEPSLLFLGVEEEDV